MIGSLSHADKQCRQGLRPRVRVVLGYPHAIPQQMPSTDTVLTGRAIVTDPPIRDHAAPGVRQDANLVHGLLTPFAMPGGERHPWGGGDSNPVHHALDPRARFHPHASRDCTPAPV
jgi:hypothetical protein